MTEAQWNELANNGLIGLGPKPGETQSLEGWWPREGYDGHLFAYHWNASTVLQQSGYSREEWLGLADIMIKRWQDWRSYVAELPDTPTP